MNLSQVLKKYRGILLTKPENVRSVSGILHLDPDITYFSGADVHKYDDINIRQLTRCPETPIVISFYWCYGRPYLIGGLYDEQEQQYYLKDIELLEHYFSNTPIILNETNNIKEV